MQNPSDPHWLLTLLTSPAFVWLCALLIISGWLIYFVRSGRGLPRIRGRHKDTEIEIDPSRASAPSTSDGAIEPPPTVESSTAPPDGETKDPQSSRQPAPEVALWVRLYDQRDKGAYALTAEWRAMADEIAQLSTGHRDSLQVTYLRYRLEAGDDSAVTELLELAAAAPTRRSVTCFLALHYFTLGRLDEAQLWAEQTIKTALSASEHTQAFVLRLQIEAKRSWPTTLALARALITKVTNKASRSAILKYLSDVAVSEKQYELAAVYAQAALDESPDNTDDRFSFAHGIGDGDEHKVFSYAHYRFLERVAPEKESVLNNVSFMCADLGEPVLYGAYLERATKQQNRGWAIANVAIKLAEIGFLDAAEAKLAEIPADQAQNDRAAIAREYLVRLRKQGEEAQVKLDRQSTELVKFFSAAGKTLLRDTLDIANSRWTNGPASITLAAIDGGHLSVQAHYKNKSLAGTLVGFGTHYRGKIQNDGSVLSKTQFTLRVVASGGCLTALFEELDYAEKHVVGSETLVLGPAS